MNSQSALAVDSFEKFANAKTCESILHHFENLCETLEILPTNLPQFLPVLQELVTSADARDLFAKFNQRLSSKVYKQGRACADSSVLIIGAGPCGLRSAVEAQLLGARVVVVEKRFGFTRNNVLHLWPFVLTDLRDLGAKRFCPKFCPGSIDHVSIAQLQCILLKIALTLGVEVVTGTEFLNLVEPEVSQGQVEVKGQSNATDTPSRGWRAATTAPRDHNLHHFGFDVILGADGRQNVLPGFRRKELRAKLAIAITANFVNRRSAAEVKVQEISGVSSIFRQSLFQKLADETGIDLENIVYYKDETHYFVMTAKKQSLLWKGVLKDNYADTDDLLSPENIDLEALEAYTLEAVSYVTNDGLPNPEFALNTQGKPDLAIFDFTKMYAAENSCRVLERHGCRLLLGLVGDSLLEPFWPTGSGCARGFLSALDAAWMIRSWSRGEEVLDVLAERETIYRLLGQTTHDNLSKDFKSYTVDPTTRYPNLVTGTVLPTQIAFLYDSDTHQRAPHPRTIQKQATKPRAPKCQELVKPEVTQVKRSPSPRKVRNDTNFEKVSIKNEVKVTQEGPLDIDFLVNWLRVTLDSYGIKVSGIHDIFVTGDALCGVIHVFRPDLIPQYPFPSEIEEGIEVSDLAAFRNQIAFDFLNTEYGLPYIVSGYDSVQYTMTHLHELIQYLFQVYSIFSTTVETAPPQRKLCRSATFSARDSERQIPKSGFSEANGRGHCIRNLQQRFQELQFKPAESFENRSVRRRDAEKCKLKALEFMSSIHERQNEAEKEAIEARRERVIKTIRAVHVTQPESASALKSASVTTTKENDDFFNEYNLRLWRKSAPSMEERLGKLETALAVPLPSAAKGSNSSQDRKSLRRAKSFASPSGATPKVNTKDWVHKLLSEKFPDAPPPVFVAPPLESADMTAQVSKPKESTSEISSILRNEICAEWEDVGEVEGVILDKVPERVCYSARADDAVKKSSKTLNAEPSVEFDEKDEDLLELLDSSELEHLEAWTGKYL